MNEIHGAWFDPSNPVVKMNGLVDFICSFVFYETTKKGKRKRKKEKKEKKGKKEKERKIEKVTGKNRG